MILHSKKEFQNVFLQLLAPLENKFSKGCARIRLSGAGACYSPNAAEMEAFARPLWGLVPYWAGGGNADNLIEKYQKGLAAGTDPTHDEFWGNCSNYDQKFVEMAPIALGLLMVPQILWQPLSQKEKENVAKWLYQINNYELPRCNWYFFRILVNVALRERNCFYSDEKINSDMNFIESCYLGDGWYVDGEAHQKDYYSAFAMQFYSLIYSKFAKDKDCGRCNRFNEYAKEFSKDFIYWFDNKGQGLPFGRSLLYRFAQTAFWSAAMFTGTICENVDVVKGLISRNFNYWLKNDIFQGDKTLSIGYTYSNLTMAERYNAPGSPYWCFKAFMVLALPDNHLFWSAEQTPLPKLDTIHCIKKADMLLSHTQNEATAYVPAVYSANPLGHYVEKYAKFAYSTNFGFSVAHSQNNLNETAPDSMLAFMLPNEEKVYVRQRSLRYEVLADKVVSVWSPMEGIIVETVIIPCEDGHLRSHKILTDKNCIIYDCGFSVALYEKNYNVETKENMIIISNILQGCKIECLDKFMKPYLIEADPNTNLLYKNTSIPSLCCCLNVGQHLVNTKITTWVNDL